MTRLGAHRRKGTICLSLTASYDSERTRRRLGETRSGCLVPARGDASGHLGEGEEGASDRLGPSVGRVSFLAASCHLFTLPALAIERWYMRTSNASGG